MEPVVLIILDGWGYDPEKRGNAIAMASTPNLDMLENSYPSGLLQASGISAGLPWEEAGNSEVGHMSLGTGKIFYQALTRINQQIKSGSFFENEILKKAVTHTNEFSSSLHLMGLLGKGSVHSYIGHIEALLDFAQKEEVQEVFLHLFLDGRDTYHKEGVKLIEAMEKKLAKKPNVHISTIIGRHYAMDRDGHWDRIEKAYQAIVNGQGEKSSNPVQSIKEQYKAGLTDEYIEPIIVEQKQGVSSGLVKEDDAVIFFNFREDRARQLSYSFVALEKVGAFVPRKFENIFFVSMIEYDSNIDAHVAFQTSFVGETLSEIISQKGKKQFKIAETEKYAHITYFFDGGKEKENEGEVRKLIPSIDKNSYSKSPELRAKEIEEELLGAINQKEYSFILANFANADMLGHTGDMESTIRGIEALDSIVGNIVKEVLSINGVILISSDHGNAERMMDIKTGEVLTSHTSNPVPYWIIANSLKKETPSPNPKEINGILPDLTATVFKFLNIPLPDSMDGTSLI